MVDEQYLQKHLEIHSAPKRSRAFDNSEIRTVGLEKVKVNFGARSLNHELKVVKTQQMGNMAIPGRDFQVKFKCSTFDGVNGEIMLRDQQIISNIWIKDIHDCVAVAAMNLTHTVV